MLDGAEAEEPQIDVTSSASFLERFVMWFLRHGKSECPNCGAFNNVGTPCRCFSSRSTDIGKQVRDCFDDVDWSKQTFVFGGVKAETSDVATVFYKAKDIDSAIEKLNQVLNSLDT